MFKARGGAETNAEMPNKCIRRTSMSKQYLDLLLIGDDSIILLGRKAPP
jgi:hypothetical protein